MCVLFKTWIGDLIATKKVRCVRVSILGTICNALFWPVTPLTTVLCDNGMKWHTIGCQPGHLDLEYSGSQRGVICLVPGKTVASKHCFKHSNKFKQIAVQHWLKPGRFALVAESHCLCPITEDIPFIRIEHNLSGLQERSKQRFQQNDISNRLIKDS